MDSPPLNSELSPDELQAGDILACYGGDWPSRLICAATATLFASRHLRWPPSHVAIVCPSEAELLWVESTTFCDRPCRAQGVPVSGVQAHRPADRLVDYLREGGRVDVYRLADIDRLSTTETRLLRRILLQHFIGRRIRYDVRGAALSGTRFLHWTRLFPGADLERLFCSELIAAVLMRLGRMNRANPSRFHPGRLLRELVKTGSYLRIGPLHPGDRS
ncbi:MAG: hypothetical protein R3B90_10000 [Planctomycetaceae bacterium]